MSSFVVSKREFIKAAGLMCGYEQGRGRDCHKWFCDNVRSEMEHAYALNVVSVNAQYGEDSMPEEGNYDALFEAYRKQGELIRREGYASTNGVIYEKVANVMSKRDFRRAMFRFFTSVLYQIEDDAANRAVAAWFFTCLDHLYEEDLHGVDGWWGEVEIEAA